MTVDATDRERWLPAARAVGRPQPPDGRVEPGRLLVADHDQRYVVHVRRVR